MKLNAREQLVLVVVLVILVWIGGVVLFIKPSIEAVRNASEQLSNKEIELAGKQQIIKDDENLQQEVDDAYATATETASVFYPRMIQHEAATEVQGQLDLDGKTDVQEIQNLNLTVSTVTAANINRYVYVPDEVNTSLDTIVSRVNDEQQDGQIVANAIDMTAYAFSFNFIATKKDLMQYLENLQNNSHRSLVVTDLAVANVYENEDDTEWNGSISLMLYMAPELPKPEDVDNKKADAETVDAVEE